MKAAACRMHWGWAVYLVALMVSAAPAAQDKPDLSGQWIRETRAASDTGIPRALSIRQSRVQTDVSGKPMKSFFKDITIEREFESGFRTETFLIGVVGGMVPGVRMDGSPTGPQVHTVVRWEGSALAIERRSHTGPTAETGVWTERREVWSMEGGRRLRLTVISRSSVEDPKTVSVVYRRR